MGKEPQGSGSFLFDFYRKLGDGKFCFIIHDKITKKIMAKP
jgi:hypothetical protein